VSIRKSMGIIRYFGIKWAKTVGFEVFAPDIVVYALTVCTCSAERKIETIRY